MAIDAELELIAIRRERRRRDDQSGHAVEIRKCRESCEYFIDTYGIIDNSQRIGEPEGASIADDGSGTTPFRLWPDQRQVLRDIESSNRVVILKARQLGISWTVIGFIWWLCKWHAGEVALLFSITEEDANELIRRIMALESRLPEWLRSASPVERFNLSSIHFANGSRIISRAATPTGGSGMTASILVIDELAKIRYARQLYGAAWPTVNSGQAKLVTLSTAWGTGDLFENIWDGAIAGTNGFKPIFLPWMAHPGRDQAWYDRTAAEATDPDFMRENYPANPTEAFVTSGLVRFHHTWIVAQADHLREPIPKQPGFLYGTPGLSVYVRPGDRPRRVGIGCDVAEGIDGDYECATGFDLDTLEELFCFHGHMEGDQYGDLLAELSKMYRAWIVVERNNHGFGILARLRALNCPAIAIGPDGREGWPTNLKTKPMAIGFLAEALRDDQIIIHSAATLTEIRNYRKLGNGKTGAPQGQHDDRVMSVAILLGWLRSEDPNPEVGEAQLRPNPLNGPRWGSEATHAR